MYTYVQTQVEKSSLEYTAWNENYVRSYQQTTLRICTNIAPLQAPTTKAQRLALAIKA